MKLMLSLIIPCFNAAKIIDAHVGKLVSYLEKHFPAFEVIVVDDGSTDATTEKVAAYAQSDPRVLLLRLGENRGKGAAVKAGVEKSRGEAIVFTDADLPYRLEEIPIFTRALLSGSFDLVLGTRYERGEEVDGNSLRGAKRSLLSRLFVFLTAFVLPKSVSDTQCGLKGFTGVAARAIFSRLSTTRFAFDVEAIAWAQLLGLRIKMQAVSLVNQGDSSVRLGRDGIRMLLDLFRIFLKVRGTLIWRSPWLLALLSVILLAPAFLYPNIFGNQPDALADESYFLTSALSSLEKKTLPGWEFSESGAYYGGVQAYIDTVGLIPVLAGRFLIEDFSLDGLRLYATTHTGDLLHILRLVNGLALLALIFFLVWYLRKRDIPRSLVMRLGLLLLLLLGNSLLVMLAHTAKIWMLYIVFELVAVALVMAQEYYLRHKGEPFLRTPLYVGLLLWLAVLAFFQSYVGVATTGAWLVWAWWLEHFRLRDIWEHLRDYWYLFLLFAITQVSFLWRAFVERPHGSTLLDFGGFTTPGEGGQSVIDWGHRFWAPLENTFLSQPLILLFPLLVVLLLFVSYRKQLNHSARYLAVALIHPLWAYIVFYLVLGFDVAPRYAVLLGVAVSISIAMLIPLRGFAYKAVASIGAALALAVLVHSAILYWSPTYQSVLTDRIEEMRDRADVVIVVDPTAVAYQLPMNKLSLERLSEVDRQIGRYAYLLAHLPETEAAVSFKPLVLYTRSAEERERAVAHAKEKGGQIYLISLPPGTENSAEPSILPIFFRTDRLGQAYVMERLYP